jgi:DNA invertase Pin-like site-specific DNA recombinase
VGLIRAIGAVPLEDRAGLSAALDTVLRTGAGVLVVARHDRLARDTLVALLIEQAFASAGARICFTDGANGQGDTDRFLRTMMHAVAEQNKRETVRRLRAGRDAKLDRNPHAYVGGRPPFGYRSDPTHELVIDAEAASIVRDIFERARGGASIRAIAAALNSDQAGGRRWHPTAVARILNDDTYKLVRPGRIVDPKLWNAAQRARAAHRKTA